MSVTDIVAYENPPPAPMAIFNERVVHPDNAARLEHVKARLQRFKPLPFGQVVRLQFRLNRLHARLRRAGIFDLVSVLNIKVEERGKVFAEWVSVKQQLDALRDNYHPVTPELYQLACDVRARGKRLNEQIAALERRIDPYEKMYGDYVRARDRLAEHISVKKRLREEEHNRRQFFKEGKIIQRALIETFMMTDGCHVVRFTRGGKPKKIAPRFQEIYLSSTVHSFVLLTSKKTLFGWKNKLMVNIEKLIDPKTTLKNASAILHRQVWVGWDRTGSLPIFKVNRLDIRDGLPERVLFAGLIDIYPVSQHDYVPIPVGLGENFRAQWMTLDSTPHILIAGATRSGKSNFVNSMICTILYTQAPSEVRIIAVDNKEGVEFNRYASVPHLVSTVADTGDQVLPLLKQCLNLMRARLRLLKESNTKNILTYNRAVGDEHRMPRLLIFIDEMATLLNRTDTNDIHHALTLLTAQGAAAGVHLVAATQYPNAETIPMTVKGNMDGIIGFRMPNVHASNMLFNGDEAFRLEKVKGRAYVSDAGERYKSQTGYIIESEIDRAIRFAIDQYKPVPFKEIESLEDTQPILPVQESFSERDVIELALSEFGGALKLVPMFNRIRSEMNITRDELRALIQSIVAQKTITHEGITYRIGRQAGNYYRLINDSLPALPTSEDSQAVPEPPEHLPI